MTTLTVTHRALQMKLLSVACLLLCLSAGLATASAQSKGRTLGLSSAEVDIAVGSVESEITATLQFRPRPAPKTTTGYDLFIPVYVPTSQINDTGAMKKYKPALSVERRPVVLTRAEPPAAIARLDIAPGMTIVWWKAIMRWPRPGEALIVDMRYTQPHMVNGRMRSCIYVPIAPDGELSKDSLVRLRAEPAGTALYLRSGKIRKTGPFAKWTGKGKSIGKSLECTVQHKLPIIADLVAAP
ncbi:MAG: hypothetical protein KDN22_10790 [Verrucomicrobiae bacterium]|nr:hypothetical protein [Verrucomicrobiae bacterium]